VYQVKSLFPVALIAGWVVSSGSVVQAHPGHGEVGPTHYVTSPEHLLTILGVSLTVLFIFWGTARWLQGKVNA
jgi:hypothetical protein